MTEIPQFLAPDGADAPQWAPAQQMEAAAAAFLEPAAGDVAPERDPEHDYAVPAAPPPPTTAPAAPMFAGTYAVYDDGTGGYVLVLGQSTGETLHHRIPAAMVKMAERFGGGASIAKMFGGG